MSKKHFIALADYLRLPGMIPASIDIVLEREYEIDNPLREDMVKSLVGIIAENLSDFCKSQNRAFDRDRWLDYVSGKCGPNGGKL